MHWPLAIKISIAWCKRDVTPLLMHWSYVSFVLSHWYDLCSFPLWCCVQYCISRLHMMTSSNGTFSTLLAICAGNSPVIGEFPTQRPVTRSFDVFFDLRLNKRLSKQCDLRRHHTHYDVNVRNTLAKWHVVANEHDQRKRHSCNERVTRTSLAYRN